MPGAVHRYMAPLLVKPACLRCHEHQGYRVGDVRGGISVTMPSRALEAMTHQRRWQAAAVILSALDSIAPLDVAAQVKESLLDRIKTIIVTSATLTVGGDFGYLKRRTGFAMLDKERLDELRLASPFDYNRQVFVARVP